MPLGRNVVPEGIVWCSAALPAEEDNLVYDRSSNENALQVLVVALPSF